MMVSTMPAQKYSRDELDALTSLSTLARQDPRTEHDMELQPDKKPNASRISKKATKTPKTPKKAPKTPPAKAPKP
jgi:hypothetical protein